MTERCKLIARRKTYREAQRDLSALLEQATAEGGVCVQRDNGQLFVIKPTDAKRSPLDVPGINLGISTDEIVEFIHEGRRVGRVG